MQDGPKKQVPGAGSGTFVYKFYTIWSNMIGGDARS
jgi:hypothetical protein